MLAQLLIQFQKPIIIENALQNATNPLTNGTFNNYLNNSINERLKRSLPNVSENEVPRDQKNLVVKENLIAPELPNGKTNFMV